MYKAKVLSLLFIVCLVVAVGSHVSAAELKGNMWVKKSKIPSGSTLLVTCGKWTGKTNFTKKGSYSLRRIPSNRSCTLRVTFPNATSAPIPFGTRKSVVRINAELKLIGKALIILRR